MLEVIKTFDNVGEIVILDNDSNYEPLLDWYSTNPCKVIKVKNCGHLSVWMNEIPKKLGFKNYVVTDPDLNLSETPKDCLNYLLEKINKNNYDKIGLSLKNWEVSKDSPYHEFLINWAKTTWNPNSVFNGLLLDQQIDTIFAIYDINKNPRGNSCATYLPYSADHIPWNFTKHQIENLKEENFEYYYYLKNSNNSSSYKNFLNF